MNPSRSSWTDRQRTPKYRPLCALFFTLFLALHFKVHSLSMPEQNHNLFPAHFLFHPKGRDWQYCKPFKTSPQLRLDHSTVHSRQAAPMSITTAISCCTTTSYTHHAMYYRLSVYIVKKVNYSDSLNKSVDLCNCEVTQEAG